jgi:SSS family solute:Na+ symporter
MNFASVIDVAVFVAFLIAVLVIGIGMSRRGKGSGENSEAYFLAGRGLAWWLIGFSLIAANISTEQFVGMSGNAANYIGLAVASYEWIAALSLVIVAFLFLPRFLKAGVYTIPHFLETRYNKAARSLMAITMVAVLVCVNIAVIVYSGAKAYSDFFHDFGLHSIAIGGTEIPLTLTMFCWVIGLLAASYVFVGGLKACAWADLLQGSALILCGCLILYFALGALGTADNDTLKHAIQANVEQAGLEFSEEKQNEMLSKLEQCGALERFATLNSHKLRMNLPWRDTFLPITALLFGIWIPNLYYWGLNQYIMQRTLGSQSLAQGQKGIVFAAFLKLLIPFIVLFPGIIAFNLYNDTMKTKLIVDNERFESLSQEYKAKNLLFNFDGKFAQQQPDMAAKMLKFNEEQFMLSGDYQENPAGALEAMKQKTASHGFGQTFSDYDYDSAFSLLMQRLIPEGGLRGFMLAALLGMIVSTLAAMFNAASTIFTMDIYKEYLHKGASEKMLVSVGRVCVILAMLSSCCLAPKLADPKFGGVFVFIQEFQGYISPGVLAAFLFGFLVRRAPKMCGVAALLLNPVIYGSLMMFASHLSFLDRMSITFVSIVAIMTLMTIRNPLKEPFKLEAATTLDLRYSKSAVVLGLVVAVITIVLYIHFWDYETPMFEGMFDRLGTWASTH